MAEIIQPGRGFVMFVLSELMPARVTQRLPLRRRGVPSDGLRKGAKKNLLSQDVIIVSMAPVSSPSVEATVTLWHSGA